MTRRYFWIAYVLHKLGAPNNAACRSFLLGWWAAEGGGRDSTAKWNWLNTTMPWSGATPYNSVGVRNYPSWLAGCRATVATLNKPLYADIRAALRSGNPYADGRWPVAGLATWVSGGPSIPYGLKYAARVRLLALERLA